MAFLRRKAAKDREPSDRQKSNAATFRRSLGKGGIFTFMFSLGDQNSWFFLTWQYALLNGGGYGAVCSFCIAVCGCGCILICYVFQAANLPSNFGPAFWTYVYAHPRGARLANFVNAYCLQIGWALGQAGANNYIASLIIVGWQWRHEEYVFDPMHVVIAAIVLATIALLCNVYIQQVKYLSSVAVVSSITAWMMILIVLSIGIASASHHEAPRDSIINNRNWDHENGWPELGVASLVNLNSPAVTFIGVDAGTHMALETNTPGRSIPLGILLATLFGYSQVFSSMGLIVASDYDRDFAARCPSVPLAALHHASGGNDQLTLAFLVLIMLTLGCNAVNQMSAASRMNWTFCDGFGDLKFFQRGSKISLRTRTPLAILAAQYFLTVALAFTNLSEIGVLIVPATSITFLMLSYATNLGALLRHIFLQNGTIEDASEHRSYNFRPKRGQESLHIPLALVKCTAPIAFTFAVMLVVFLQFPPAPGPSPASFNWSPVMVGFFGLVGIILWNTLGYAHWTPVDYHGVMVFDSRFEAVESATENPKTGSYELEMRAEKADAHFLKP